jgi:hypothetical protein
MQTECRNEKLEFQAPGARPIVAEFNGGTITYNVGVLLLKESEASVSTKITRKRDGINKPAHRPASQHYRGHEEVWSEANRLLVDLLGQGTEVTMSKGTLAQSEIQEQNKMRGCKLILFFNLHHRLLLHNHHRNRHPRRDHRVEWSYCSCLVRTCVPECRESAGCALGNREGRR